jgi:uncharacterized membrane protein
MRGHFEGPFDGRYFLGGPTILALILIALLVAALVVVIVWATRNRAPVTHDPLQMAAARYASGKIDRIQFEQIQRDLGGATASVPGPGEPPSEA